MKKLILLSFLSLTACNYYTIQNDYTEEVRAGYVLIKSGQCLEFFDLPILGDFPLKFRYKDHQLMFDDLYKPGHYKVSKQGDILKQTQPCDLDPVREKDNLKEKAEDQVLLEQNPIRDINSSESGDTEDPPLERNSNET